MKNIIHIYGASGSGTTTLGKKICVELGYTFMDTDDYFWLPTNPKYTIKRKKEERIALMKKDIEKVENVVISGSLVDWGDELISCFTLAIRVFTDTDIRIERLKQREHKRFGSRVDIGGDMYQNYIEFLEWARKYDTGSVNMRSKAKHDEWQKLLKCPQLVINGADDLQSNFIKIQSRLDFDRIKQFVNENIKDIFGGDASGHDYWHSIRVYNNAMLISKAEKSNELVVMLASLLHDVDDQKLFTTQNYENARNIMSKCNIHSEIIEEVVEAIKTVSFKGSETLVPETIEGKIVQDADRLDAIGAIGIARTFAFGGNRNREIHNPEQSPKMNLNDLEYKTYAGTTINHFYEKLFKLKDIMNTETARRIAKRRDDYLHEFIKEFYAEWNGEC